MKIFLRFIFPLPIKLSSTRRSYHLNCTGTPTFLPHIPSSKLGFGGKTAAASAIELAAISFVSHHFLFPTRWCPDLSVGACRVVNVLVLRNIYSMASWICRRLSRKPYSGLPCSADNTQVTCIRTVFRRFAGTYGRSGCSSGGSR